MSIGPCVTEITITNISPFYLSMPFLDFLLLNLLSMHHETRYLHIINKNYVSLFNHHFGKTQYKLTHLWPWICNDFGEYTDNRMKFSAYSLTLILPCRRLMNSSTLASLISKGKYSSRKEVEIFSQSRGPAYSVLPSFHYLYHIRATPFNW